MRKLFAMLITAIITLVVVIGALWVVAKRKPDTYQVERQIDISAPPDAVFALINDFHLWRTWAPQDIEDPSMTRTFSGPSAGLGAISSWSGRSSSGQGRMEITESKPPLRVTVTVDFAKPFVAHNINEFVLEQRGAITHLTWSMRGTNPMLLRVMSIFTNLDKMMGKHFESGLRRLKQAAEQPAGSIS